jgi:O-antigen ligase
VVTLAALAAIGLVNDVQTGLTEGRMDGVAFGFTDLAILCGLGLVWSLVLFDQSRSLRWLVPIPVFLAALAGSGARLPTLAAMITCFLVVTHRWTSRVVILSALAALLVAVQAGNLVPSQFDRAEIGVSSTGAPVEPSPLNGRFDIWDHALGLVAEDPLTGYGLKAGNAAWTEAYIRGDLQISAGHSHNSILELAAATGLIGAALFGVFLLTTFFGLYRKRLRGPLLVGLFLLLCGLTEAVVEGQTIGLIQYLALGAMAGGAGHDPAGGTSSTVDTEQRRGLRL